MSDQQFAGESGELPVGRVVPANAEANNAQPETPMTRDEIKKIVEEVSAKQFQALQSMQSKQEERLKREVSKRLEALQESGIQITPEQAKKVQEATIKQFKESDGDGQRQDAQPAYQNQPGDNQPPMDPVSQAAYEIMKEENVFINEGDPELAIIDRQTTSRKLFLRSVDKAIEAKKERLSRPRGTPAASPSMAATGGNVDANTLEAQYNKEYSQIKRGDSNALLRLKRKYREKGLAV